VEESVAVQVFANLGLSVKQIRGKVLELLGPGEEERKTNFSFAVNIEEGEDAKVVGKVAAHYKNILGRIKESIHHADSKAMEEIRNILKDI
jgi:predicted DNA-binding antitoxin AbrB/MazE fold protein